MSFQPLIDQRTLGPQSTSDCFQACLMMVMGHLGRPYDRQAILDYHSGVTSTNTALAMCQHFGLKGCSVTRGSFTNRDSLVIALFRDNALANPDVRGSFEHYSVVYGQDVHAVYVANPWGARDIFYSTSVFNLAYIAAIVVPISANRYVAPAPLLIGEQDVWQQLLANDDFALSEVLKAHLLVSAAYGRINPGETFPATGQDEANEIAALRANGLAQFITYLKNIEIGNPPGQA